MIYTESMPSTKTTTIFQVKIYKKLSVKKIELNGFKYKDLGYKSEHDLG
jgi:hypothetical protein